MTASFILELDTTAPDVVFGAAGGTTAGELLQIEYASSEPIASAELIAGRRTLAMTVGPDALEVLLPADVADGWATIRVRDDVGNTATHAAAVDITGTIEPELPPVPTPPRPRDRGIQRRDRRLVRSSSRCRASATTTVRCRRGTHTTAAARSGSALRAAVGGRALTRAVSRGAVRAQLAAGSHAPASTRASIVRRRGDPPPEVLIALDLL